MKPSDDRLRRLLSGRNALSAADKDAVLDQVLAEVERSGAAPVRAWRWSIVVAVATAAGALVVSTALVPRTELPEWVERGVSTPQLYLSCGDTPCHAGSTLMFQLEPAGRKYFSAVARRGEALTWYFVDLDLSKQSGSGVLGDGVVLGPDAAGSYEVVGIFADSPQGREAVKQALDRTRPPLAQVRVTLVVAP
jgi:hypothetical protein